MERAGPCHNVADRHERHVLGTSATATVPASLVATAGTATVNTLSPHSGAGTNGLSNSIAFIITPAGNPLPTISSISPSLRRRRQCRVYADGNRHEFCFDIGSLNKLAGAVGRWHGRDADDASHGQHP